MNMDEPIPPIPRKATSWRYVWEKPAIALEIATMRSPDVKTIRSPRRSTSTPAIGANTNRIKAKTEMTALACRAVTSKVLAKMGSAGAKIPNPMATKNAITERTATSFGSPLRRGVRLRAPPRRRVREAVVGWSSGLAGISGTEILYESASGQACSDSTCVVIHAPMEPLSLFVRCRAR